MDRIMKWHLPGPGGETELRSQANLAGNVIPFDPAGWQGLGNVSLHSFPPFPRGFPLPPGRSAKLLPCSRATGEDVRRRWKGLQGLALS